MPVTEAEALNALEAEIAKGDPDAPQFMAALYRWIRLSKLAGAW